MKIRLSEIVKDDDIYPRIRISQNTVDAYVESLKAGAEFPPIEVQRIVHAGVRSIIALDGWHRIEAYKKCGLEEIEVEYWRDEELEKEKYLIELMTRSIKRNVTHGLRLSNKDKEIMCRLMAEDDPLIEMTEEKFAKIFEVTRQTINNWIKDIRARQRMTRENAIFRLIFQGWTQREIADSVGLNRQRVQQIASIANVAKTGEVVAGFESGKTVVELADMYRLEPLVIHAITLNGKSDDERFRHLLDGTAPTPFNIWPLDEVRDIFHALLHLLYYFTEPDDLVCDLMADSRITVACIAMGRKCRAYTTDPDFQSVGIKYWDITQDVPERVKGKCDFIFLNSSSTFPYKDSLVFIKMLAKHSYEVLKPDGKAALMIWGKTDKEYDTAMESYAIFLDNGFEYVTRIFCISPEPPMVMRKHKELVRIDRDILVFKKSKEPNKKVSES